MKDIKSFPPQKLPMSKKNEAWKRASVDYIAGAGNTGHSGFNSERAAEMQTYYDLYNSIYDERDLKYVTNPFKQKDGFPATAQDYNIIKPYIDQLLGEETKRTFNFSVCRTNEDATSQLQDWMKERLTEYMMAAIQGNMDPQRQQQFQQQVQSGQVMTPPQIQKYAMRDYKDIAETCAYNTLNYLKTKLNVPNEFYKGWKDGLIGGEEIYYVGIKNGDPCVERVNPMYFDYEKSVDLEFIHDAAWCCRKMIMSATEIYDRFYDKMDEKQLNELLELIDEKPGSGLSPQVEKSEMDFNHVKLRKLNSFTDNPFDTDQITVYHCCWKSFKKIGFVTIANFETGEVQEFQVDETYKVTGEEIDVTWRWIIEVWEGYRIGDDMYIGIQPLEYQHVSADNPNSARLPYTGAIYNNTNSKCKSLVSIMKPLQYMYIVIWYRLELAMARDKGKVALIDVTQIPKGMGIDINKWMHYLSALGVAFINPYEDGWDIPGREGGRSAAFNQFQSWDLSMAAVIDQYVNLMAKIEDMMSRLTGITPQRQGSIAASELVGNATQAITQSYHITEPWFWLHNQIKREVLTMLLDTAKSAWKGNKMHLNFMQDDATRAFITLSEDFFYSDYDIFIEDSTKNRQDLDALRQLMQPAMQNGASLLDIAEIITLDNISMIKNKLEDIEQKRMQQMQQQQQQEQQAQQQQIQEQNRVKEEELMLKEAEMDLEKYKIDTDSQTKIAVAQINAYRGSENMDQNNNGIPDPIEIGKQMLEQRKQDADMASKSLDNRAKMRDIENKKEIENKKIQLEKDRMNHEEKLQRMKDEAAMEREKIKARAAAQRRNNSSSKK